ncbi:MAG: SBBP repeat-containing protein [Saprospiraceae bacterium]|nr:SBBP repeat-containing protein [Saprospiraceae bacterium]
MALKYRTSASQLDSKNNIIADGNTRDASLPTKNAIRPDFNANDIIDIYLIKLDTTGEIMFATYLGGEKVNPSDNPLDLNGRDYTGGIAIDRNDNIYITGETDGLNFPTTSNALNRSNVGNWDLFLTEFSPAGSLLYSTFLGDSKMIASIPEMMLKMASQSIHRVGYI